MIAGRRSPAFLYELMPIVHRRRDIERGGNALRALLGVAQRAFELLEDDIGGLYDNWFVETCEPWVLPYLAELLAIPPELTGEQPAADLRRLVANVVDYRRRKGTPGALAEIASDVTGWTVRSVEASSALARTPHMSVRQAAGPRSADVRALVAMADVGGAFDAVAHTVDVRSSGRAVRRAGNVGALAVYVWRDVSATLSGVDAHHVGENRYTFDPLGYDAQLANEPLYDAASPERAVPAPLRNVRLRDELLSAGPPVYLTGDDDDVLRIEVRCGEKRKVLARGDLAFVDLGRWARPLAGKALVDVERGRFVLDPAWTAPRVDATWSISGDVGGGAYRRKDDASPADVELVVARDAVDDPSSFTTPQAAFEKLVELNGFVRIVIADSGTYRAPAGGWTLPAGVNVHRVELVAAAGARPVLDGSLVLAVMVSGAHVVIDGVLLRGSLLIDAQPDAGDLQLIVRDSTIVPGATNAHGGAALGTRTNAPLLDASVVLHRTICGRIRLPELGTRLDAMESIVDGTGEAAIAGVGDAGPQTVLDRCTVFGDVQAFACRVSGSIVTGMLAVRAGDASAARYAAIGRIDWVEQRYAVRTGVPRFVSRRYGSCGYARLALDAGAFALGGAVDGGELGAFSAAATGRRLANMQLVLDEYVPYGVADGVIDEG